MTAVRAGSVLDDDQWNVVNRIVERERQEDERAHRDCGSLLFNTALLAVTLGIDFSIIHHLVWVTAPEGSSDVLTLLRSLLPMLVVFAFFLLDANVRHGSGATRLLSRLTAVVAPMIPCFVAAFFAWDHYMQISDALAPGGGGGFRRVDTDPVTALVEDLGPLFAIPFSAALGFGFVLASLIAHHALCRVVALGPAILARKGRAVRSQALRERLTRYDAEHTELETRKHAALRRSRNLREPIGRLIETMQRAIRGAQDLTMHLALEDGRDHRVMALHGPVPRQLRTWSRDELERRLRAIQDLCDPAVIRGSYLHLIDDEEKDR